MRSHYIWKDKGKQDYIKVFFPTDSYIIIEYYTKNKHVQTKIFKEVGVSNK